VTTHQVQLLFADLALILLLARGLAHLAARLQQPPVMGEILAGVLLGPTLLNGAISDTLFPTDVRPLLSGIANVGLALFMFAVGLEIELHTLRGRERVTAGAAIGSTAVPFALGIGLALYLAHGRGVADHAAFVVFIALSVSVTAFPVLARILADRALAGTKLGGLALATSAVVDVFAWVGLAAVQAAVGGHGQYWLVALIIPFTVVLVLLVRPALRRLLVPGGTPTVLTPWVLAVVLVGALLSAAATEAMGMHFIFGAFLFGVMMPRQGVAALRTEVLEHTGRVTSLLLPVYFVVAGLQVNLAGLHGTDLLRLGAILLVSVAGKFGGTYAGARLQGLPGRPAAALGVLMNTRGLTELVILGIGLQLHLLDGSLYSLMVVMAVITTAMTGPLLTRIYTKPVDALVAHDRRKQESSPASTG
jgi:Kef-type K+ transport system membrane component KefB